MIKKTEIAMAGIAIPVIVLALYTCFMCINWGNTSFFLKVMLMNIGTICVACWLGFIRKKMFGILSCTILFTSNLALYLTSKFPHPITVPFLVIIACAALLLISSFNKKINKVTIVIAMLALAVNSIVVINDWFRGLVVEGLPLHIIADAAGWFDYVIVLRIVSALLYLFTAFYTIIGGILFGKAIDEKTIALEGTDIISVNRKLDSLKSDFASGKITQEEYTHRRMDILKSLGK